MKMRNDTIKNLRRLLDRLEWDLSEEVTKGELIEIVEVLIKDELDTRRGKADDEPTEGDP